MEDLNNHEVAGITEEQIVVLEPAQSSGSSSEDSSQNPLDYVEPEDDDSESSGWAET